MGNLQRYYPVPSISPVNRIYDRMIARAIAEYRYWLILDMHGVSGNCNYHLRSYAELAWGVSLIQFKNSLVNRRLGTSFSGTLYYATTETIATTLGLIRGLMERPFDTRPGIGKVLTQRAVVPAGQTKLKMGALYKELENFGIDVGLKMGTVNIKTEYVIGDPGYVLQSPTELKLIDLFDLRVTREEVKWYGLYSTRERRFYSPEFVYSLASAEVLLFQEVRNIHALASYTSLPTEGNVLWGLYQVLSEVLQLESLVSLEGPL